MIALETARNVNSQFEQLERWRLDRSCSLIAGTFSLFFLRFSALANKAIVKTNSFERSADMLVLSESDQAAHTGLEQMRRASYRKNIRLSSNRRRLA